MLRLLSPSITASSWWCLLFFTLSITAVVAPAPCPSNGAAIGYTTIQEINSVMATQLSAIQSGAAPQPPYIFSLCPNTTFPLNGEPLRILLNDTYVVCGTNSALSDGCVITGGDVQVSIADSKVPGYTLQDVLFQGITFRGATNSSIVASAGSTTTARFVDCLWDSNSGSNTIQIIPNSTAPKGLSLILSDCIIVNSTSAATFANQNGNLQINGLTISGSSGQAGVVTYSGGTTAMQNVSVGSSNYPYVAQTGPRSTLTIRDMDVSTLTGVTNLFVAQGSESKMFVSETSIHNIDSVAWSAVSFTLGASGTVERTSIFQNVGLDFGIVSSGGGSVNISGTLIENNVAPLGFVSSGVLALNASSVNVTNSSFINNTAFNAMVFVGFGSYSRIDDNLFQGGKATIVIFIDQDSTFSANNNTFDNIASISCLPPDQRIFVEKNGSHCFYRSIPGGVCNGNCGVVATLPPTTSPTQQTAAPSAAPSVSTLTPTMQTLAPTTAPTTLTAAPSQQTTMPTLLPTASSIAPTQTTTPPSVAHFATTTPTAIPIAPTPSPLQITASPSKKLVTQAPTGVPAVPPSATLAPTGAVYASPEPSLKGEIHKAGKFKKTKGNVKGSEKFFKLKKSIQSSPSKQKETSTLDSYKPGKKTSESKVQKGNDTLATQEGKATKTAKGTNANTKEGKATKTVKGTNANTKLSKGIRTSTKKGAATMKDIEVPKCKSEAKGIEPK